MTNGTPLWILPWCNFVGLSSDLPSELYALLALISTYFLVIVPCGGLMMYIERKFTADLQARVGPSRAGPIGIFQPIADSLKLLQKEPRDRWSWGENIWLAVYTMALYSTVAVMPLGSLALLVNTEMSSFLPFWAALVLALGTMLLGLNQNSVPGWFGGVRVAAQTLAGSFPALTAFICVGIHANSFRWSILADKQGFFPWSWTFLSNPFQTLAFIIFLISGLVLLGVPPLDGGFSISDLHGGVSSHLSGRRLSLFRFGRFYGFFFWSVITVVLFLGAWVLPLKFSEWLKNLEAYKTLALAELLWLLLKTFCLMLFVIWIARVNSRSRADQITDFSWKILSPLSLVALIGASLWAVWRAF